MIHNQGPIDPNRDPRDEVAWGVPRDPEPAERRPITQIIWLILSILIILSLVLPWILPYFTPRPRPVRDGLQAMVDILL